MKDFKSNSEKPLPLRDSMRCAPLFTAQLSPQMIDQLKKHFWCDFSDVIPALKWDDTKKRH